MGNLMTSMYTGVSGLVVNQAAINVTAHNISNVSTTGYTRQQVLTSDFTYNTIGESAISAFRVGLGTDMDSVRQVRDIFLDKSYRLELGREGFYESQYESVEEIESIFGELDGEAFKTSLSDLWSAVSEVAKEPLSTVNRGTLITTASNFLKKAKIIYDQLSSYQTNLNTKIQEKVNRINEIGDSIQELNQKIRTNESSGQSANDYRDQRNSLLDELGGLAEISYKEDAYGIVNVNVEGVQFVADNNVYHMETQKITTEEEKARADAVNSNVQSISTMIAAMKAGGSSASDIADAVKASSEWGELTKYGSISYTSSGELKYNDYTAIDSSGVAHKILPQQSELLTVVWKGNGLGEVFSLDGNYASDANTDVGSLKGLLVSRGVSDANYTAIPQQEDYASTAEYNQAVKEYNRYVDPSIIMQTQAQLDQLIHKIATTINDIFAPNMEVTSDSISTLLNKTKGTSYTPAQVDLTGATIKLPDGSTVNASDVKIFDAVNAGAGMDDAKTQGEALFDREYTERYTTGDLIVNINGTPTTIKVRVYNEEYASDDYSLYSITQMKMNDAVLNDYNVIPLSNNQYSGLSGAFNQTVCDALTDAWDKEELTLNPNTLTKNNFQDYYSAMTINIAYKGSTFKSKAENQSDMVESINNQRQETAGVSSDDELTNLIRFQHAYNASSRYINVIDKMLEHVIERLG
ncbi:MAG: flagellar hook-associated protein 1 [Clostridiales bacterium]|nr:flagellar hook-associated protein 1 [Clostridiales bacterium]